MKCFHNFANSSLDEICGIQDKIPVTPRGFVRILTCFLEADLENLSQADLGRPPKLRNLSLSQDLSRKS